MKNIDFIECCSKCENITHDKWGGESCECSDENCDNCHSKKEEYNQPEWGGWKFVSEMLDNPDSIRIYNTSKCYKQLYDFVREQKSQTLKQQKEEMIEKSKSIFQAGYELGHKNQLDYNHLEDYQLEDYEKAYQDIINLLK